MTTPSSFSEKFHFLGNPKRLNSVLRVVQPWLGLAGLILILAGCYWGLFYSPADWQQGDSMRIMYLHVPMAWLASSLYVALALSSCIYLIWRNPLAAVVAQEIAPVGALCAILCLITGSLWGKPAWGTWWVWDARLTSVLVLFFLYLGFIAVSKASNNPRVNYMSASIIAIAGVIDLPIIKFSVQWWNTLHQGPSIKMNFTSSIDSSMLMPLMTCVAGFSCWAGWIICMRIRTTLLRRRMLNAALAEVK